MSDILERLDGYQEIADMDHRCQSDMADAAREIRRLRDDADLRELTSKYVAAYIIAKPESSGSRWDGERIMKSAIQWAKATIVAIENERGWYEREVSVARKEAKP